MKKVEFENISFTLYSSIDEMPAKRYAKFQERMSLYYTLERPVSDFVAEIKQAIAHDDQAHAAVVLNNLAQMMALKEHFVNLSLLAFSVCIKGLEDFTFDGILDFAKNGLHDLPQVLISGTCKEIHDKMKQEIEIKFPEFSSKNDRSRWFSAVKENGILELDVAILPNENNISKLKETAKTLFDLSKSANGLLSDSKNISFQTEKNYSSIFLDLNKDIENITVNELLMFLLVLKERNDKGKADEAAKRYKK